MPRKTVIPIEELKKKKTRDLAKKYDVSYGVVRKLKRGAGIPPEKDVRKIGNAHTFAILNVLHNKGIPATPGNILEVNRGAMKKACKLLNIQAPSARNFNNFKKRVAKLVEKLLENKQLQN